MLSYDDIPHEFNVATYFLDRHREEGTAGRTALIADGRPYSYDDLARLTNRVGHVLRDLGLRREQRVLMVLDDGAEFVATWYATLKVGGVTAEVYTFLAPKDYVYYLQYTRAEVAVVGRNVLERFREAAPQSRHLRRVLVVGARPEDLRPGEEHFETLVAQAPDELDPEPTGRDDVAIWKFTTGSTGAPKACVHRMHTPLLSFECYARGVLGFRPDDVVLPVPKLFFGYARDLAALYPFGVGATGVVFAERTTPDTIFRLVAEHRPTILVNVPTMMRAMLDHPAAGEQDLSSLRLVTSAGEALPPDLQRRWDDLFGVEILDGMGSSEAYHIYLSCRPGAVRPGSLGQAVPGYRVTTVAEDGRELGPGEVGRIWVDGPTTAEQYFGDRAKSLETYAGSVVMTGDLGERDEDGFFWYRGRADDLLKVGGIYVAPIEIERALDGHPAVAECAVVGYTEDGLQRPRAYVVVADGHAASDELAGALRDHVRATLSPHKYPRDIRFVAELPRTGSGKIDRQALRQAPVAS
jgi:benzoate-CoA ligase family protein